jgi:hypothetical protein
MDSLSYIFDLIAIKQLANKSVVTMKARFSCLFMSLKMGGITNDSALQVGFMLQMLWTGYQAMLNGFFLGWHSLTLASLQTAVDQYILYDKDHWQGPVGCDSKPARTPLANRAATPVDRDSSNPYKALPAKCYNYHLNHWRKALINNHGKCLLCHNTVRNTNHKTQIALS